MNIVYIITGLGIGGAESITVDLANKMYERGNNVYIISLNGKNEQTDRINRNISVLELNMKKNVLSLLKSLLTVKRFLRNVSPDVIHANMVHAVIFSRLLRTITKLPYLICSEHSNNIEGRLRMLAYRLTDRLSDINTNVSMIATEQFVLKKAFSRDRSMTVYNGIDLCRFYRTNAQRKILREQLGIKDDDFVYLNIARLMPAKDHITLINAFIEIHFCLKNTKLLIIGDGELYGYIKSYIESNKLDGKVILLGSRNDVELFYNISDCFVLSSEWEGFGLVLVEAMACGLPVISTDSGGCREVIGDEQYLVPVKNSKALAEKMKYIYMLSNSDKERLSQRNIICSTRFDINKIVDIWFDLYSRKCIKV